MVVEFMLEDPEYIVGSMTHTRELIYSPQRGMADSSAIRKRRDVSYLKSPEEDDGQ